ncbi:MAG TPA: hypothetical protein VEX86_10250 [Longimicrobium sp.]|nr:hypothetical protein [Longimicrobium sp.]
MRTKLYSLRLRAAGLLCAVAVAAACNDDDGGLLSSSDCKAVRSTADEIADGQGGRLARVRVSLVSRLGVDAGAADSVSVRGARLFLGNACYRLDNTTGWRLAALENDAGGMVAEALVEPGELSELELELPKGQTGSHVWDAGRIRLDRVVKLEAGRRTDVYLSLSPVGTSGHVAARFVAAGEMPWESQTMVYDPVRGGSLSLPGGFSMELPVGAAGTPTVFGVGSYAGGGVSATYNVWPENELSEAVRVSFPIDRSRIPQGMGMSDFGGRINGAEAVSSVAGNVATVNARAFGQIGMGTSVPYVETTGGQRVAMRVPGAGSGSSPSLVNNECYARLLNARTSLYNTLNNNSGLYSSLCTDVSPRVHIVMVNLNRSGLGANGWGYPKMVIPAVRYTDGTFALREITTHMSTLTNDFAGINGFTWSGDSGCCGGYGTPIGTLYMNNERVSPWFSGTEVMIGFGAWSAYTGTPHAFFERVSGASINIGGYTNWMVPSTTSIVKNGACSRAPGGETNRWSTIGIGNGVLVMASSVSNTSTTAYELCSIYEGLGVLGGALRLDGGPSAALWWQGTTLNLLSGSDYLAMGYERDIPYVLAALTQ